MSFEKKDSEKQFVCKSCSRFLNASDLDHGACPDCESDEYVFHNELLEEDDRYDFLDDVNAENIY